MAPYLGDTVKTAVIGAGWAGLAAAERLAAQMSVVVFEAGRQAGGRARALGKTSDFAAPDNGQHILSGAYDQTLALLQRCGVREEEAFLRLPWQWRMADGLDCAAANVGASPMQMTWAILRGKGISLAEKCDLLRQFGSLLRQNANERDTVGRWLRQQAVCRRLQLVFWQPLVWGAMNATLDEASLLRLQKVVADAMASGGAASDILLPKQDLGRLFVAPVLRRLQQLGVAVQHEKRITQIERHGARWRVDGQLFDALVLAVAPYHVADVLPPPLWQSLETHWPNLNYHAITTVYLRYPQAPQLPHPMTGLAQGTAQWLFDRHALGLGRHEVSAVISLSEQYGGLSREAWGERVHADVLRLNPNLPAPEAVLAVSEKRATASATDARAMALPQTLLRRERIYLAGDYVHPHYPATLEAAVQSGRQAVACLLADHASGAFALPMHHGAATGLQVA